MAGAFLKVPLKGSGLVRVIEPEADLESPWWKLGGMGGDAGIVLGETLLDIAGYTDIALVRVGF